MNRRIKNIRHLMAALLLSAGLASCVYDANNDAAPDYQGGLTLNIQSGSVGHTTRTATDNTSGGTSTAVSAAEQKIHNVTFGVYHNGDLIGAVKQITPADPTAATTQQYTQTFQAGEATYSDGDSILVAINMPATPYAALAAAADKDGFDQVTLSIDDALTYGTGTTMDAEYLPIMGKSVVTPDGSVNGQYNATVNVYHLVAKVTLASLAVDFDDDAAHNTHAAFTPTQIFLYSVPDELDLRVNADGTYQYRATVTDYYQGESTNATGYKDYLGTSALSGTTLDETDAYGTTYTFYTMPNKAGRASLTDANRTRLIIKGKYTEDKVRDATGHDAYYAINLGSTTDHSVEANYHYIVTAVIKGDGAATVAGAIPDIKNLTTTVTASDWTEEATTVSIDNSGYHYASTGPNYTGITVGSIIYADGYWTTAYDADFATTHGNPIAIVFSTTTSTYDQGEGYTHGYAMALKRYNSGNNVANWCTNTSSLQTTQVTDVTMYALNDIRADMDGLKHCRAAYTYCDNNTIAKTELTAIYAAISGYEAEVNAPASTSGWYLPSIGQEYAWLQAAKSDVYTGTEAWTDNSTYWTRSSESAAAAGYMNTWMAASGLTSGTHYEEFAQGHYLWSSTERAAGYPFRLPFGTDGRLHLDGRDGKSDANLQVRAVLAF